MGVRHAMRILFTNDAPLIKYGVAAGIEQIGHQAKVMQGEDQLWGMDPEQQAFRLSRAIENFRPDALFTEGHPRIEPEVIDRVARKFSVPQLYWAIEDPVCTDLTLQTFAPRADYIFTTTIECIPAYERLGKKAELLLFGCNPLFHRFTGVNPAYQHDLVLVASNYSSRYEEAQWFIMPLVERGYDIKIWGIWWDDTGRPVNLAKYPQVYGGILPYELLPDVYSSAKIVLGMNCDDSSKTQTSMRPFEVLACGGGIYLSHYTKAQEYLFKDNIFQVHNAHETQLMVQRILRMPEHKRRQIAKKAQANVYAKHTYSARAWQIVNVVQAL